MWLKLTMKVPVRHYLFNLSGYGLQRYAKFDKVCNCLKIFVVTYEYYMELLHFQDFLFLILMLNDLRHIDVARRRKELKFKCSNLKKRVKWI